LLITGVERSRFAAENRRSFRSVDWVITLRSHSLLPVVPDSGKEAGLVNFHRSPDQLGAEEVCALRFFYAKTLKRAFLLQGHSLPTEGAATSLDPQSGGIGTNTHRAFASQKPCPVDDDLRRRLAALRGRPFARQRYHSARMTITVHQGKGQKDHVVMFVPGFAGYPAAVLATA
jgi:hypothetical protein